jgi:hypothetical protein
MAGNLIRQEGFHSLQQFWRSRPCFRRCQRTSVVDNSWSSLSVIGFFRARSFEHGFEHVERGFKQQESNLMDRRVFLQWLAIIISAAPAAALLPKETLPAVTGGIRRGGFCCIGPPDLYCQNCGAHRQFFFNSDGLRIWRCGKCEKEDIRAYQRGEYGETSSIQFLRHKGAR